MTHYIRGKSIVLVGYEANLVQLFSDTLKSAGFDAIPFDNPIQALKYIYYNHSRIGIIITDWRMPEMNGIEIIKLVSQMDSNINIILISDFELQKDQIKEINMDYYLKKPVHMNQLIDTVQKMYSGKLPTNHLMSTNN